MREGVTVNVVLIPSPTTANSKPDAISIPVDAEDGFVVFCAAKAQETKQRKTPRIVIFLMPKASFGALSRTGWSFTEGGVLANGG
jgi:hypothetical protein